MKPVSHDVAHCFKHANTHPRGEPCSQCATERGQTLPEKPIPLAGEPDTKLLAAFTPERYAGDYPPYINLTMVRMKGGNSLPSPKEIE